MSIISKAVIKQKLTAGGPAPNAQGSGEAIEFVKPGQAAQDPSATGVDAADKIPESPVTQTIGRLQRAPGPARHSPPRWPLTPAPAPAVAAPPAVKPKPWFFAVGALVAVAVVVGFLASGSDDGAESASALGVAPGIARQSNEAEVATHFSPPAFQTVVASAPVLEPVAPPAAVRNEIQPIIVRVEVVPVAAPVAAQVSASYVAERPSALEPVASQAVAESSLVHASAVSAKVVPAKPQSPRSALANYRLEGLFWSSRKPAAIINDKIVDEGDHVGLLLIKSIQKTHVVVELDGVEMILRQ